MSMFSLIAGERMMSASEIDLQARALAGALKGQGLEAGTRVALLLRNDFAYFLAHEAARFFPLDIVPVNWHLTADEVSYILNDCNARVVIAHADLASDDIREACAERLLLVEPTPVDIAQAYRLDPSVCDPRSADNTLTEFLADGGAIGGEAGPPRAPLMYTSGTSGQPKAVIRGELSAQVGQAIAARTAAAWGFDKPHARAVMTGPLYHSAPNGYANFVVRTGECLILQARFDAEGLLQLIEAQAITHLHMVPTMFSRLLQLADAVRARYDLSSLVHVSHGAAPCPPDVKRAMIDWWGPVIHEYYAMTETGIITVSDSQGWLAHPGSVGKAARGVQIRICDDAGKEVPKGETGVVCVKHEATSAVSYHGAPEKNAQLHSDAYLITGDVGHLDEDGYLYIYDRKSDMVISGGVNIYPAETEAVLINLDQIKDCAVLGVPDSEFGERLVAVLECTDAANAAAIADALRQQIAAFKVPREFYLTDKLPREDSGKIKKRFLREAILAGSLSRL